MSAATKQFVSTRVPLVVTDSTHSSDVSGGVVRVGGVDVVAFCKAVIETVKNEGLRKQLSQELQNEYERFNMNAVAEQYLKMFKGL